MSDIFESAKLSVKNDRNVITIISSHSLKLHSIHGYMYTMGKVYTHTLMHIRLYTNYTVTTHITVPYVGLYIYAHTYKHTCMHT